MADAFDSWLSGYDAGEPRDQFSSWLEAYSAKGALPPTYTPPEMVEPSIGGFLSEKLGGAQEWLARQAEPVPAPEPMPEGVEQPSRILPSVGAAMLNVAKLPAQLASLPGAIYQAGETPGLYEEGFGPVTQTAIGVGRMLGQIPESIGAGAAKFVEDPAKAALGYAVEQPLDVLGLAAGGVGLASGTARGTLLRALARREAEKQSADLSRRLMAEAQHAPTYSMMEADEALLAAEEAAKVRKPYAPPAVVTEPSLEPTRMPPEPMPVPPPRPPGFEPTEAAMREPVFGAEALEPHPLRAPYETPSAVPGETPFARHAPEVETAVMAEVLPPPPALAGADAAQAAARAEVEPVLAAARAEREYAEWARQSAQDIEDLLPKRPVGEAEMPPAPRKERAGATLYGGLGAVQEIPAAMRRASEAYNRAIDKASGAASRFAPNLTRFAHKLVEPLTDLPEDFRLYYLEEKARLLNHASAEAERLRKLGKTLQVTAKRTSQTLDDTEALAVAYVIQGGDDAAFSAKVFRGAMTGEPQQTRIFVTPRAKRLGKIWQDELFGIGSQMVDTGLMSEETFAKWARQYMPRMYMRHERFAAHRASAGGKPMRMDLSRVQRRADIAEITRALMGEIVEPGYPVLKGIIQSRNDVNLARLFNHVSGDNRIARVARDMADEQSLLADGWIKLPETKKLGRLSGNYVRADMYREIQGVAPKMFWDPKLPPSALEKLARQILEPSSTYNHVLSLWKLGKVFNPATMARNFMSGFILNDWGGLSPYRLDAYAKAFMAKRDPEWFREAAEDGVFAHGGGVSGELDMILHEYVRRHETAPSGALDTMMHSIRHAATSGRIGFERATAAASRLYGGIDDSMRFAMYHYMRTEGGAARRQAAAHARKYAIDYSRNPNFIRMWSRNPIGAPFIQFNFGATKLAAETAIRHPWRFYKWRLMANAVEAVSYMRDDDIPREERDFATQMWQLTTGGHKKRAAERETLPSYLRGGPLGAITPSGMVRLPAKDKYGRQEWLNFRFIWPGLADIAGLSDELSTSLYLPGSSILLGGPVGTIVDVLRNQDRLKAARGMADDRIFTELDVRDGTVAEKRLAYLWRGLAPSLAPGSHSWTKVKAYADGKGDYVGRVRTLAQLLGDVALGIRVEGIDPEEQARLQRFAEIGMARAAKVEAKKPLRSMGALPEEREDALDRLERLMGKTEERIVDLDELERSLGIAP